MKGTITIHFDETWFSSNEEEDWFNNKATLEEQQLWMLENISQVCTREDINLIFN